MVARKAVALRRHGTFDLGRVHPKGNAAAGHSSPARREEPMANHLRELNEYGQSVWLDFVSRELLRDALDPRRS
jgi:hypothetical protein